MNFESAVDRIRKGMSLSKEIPSFDAVNGNENAKFLFLLEAPGPSAIASGHISFDNPDPTARNFKNQLASAEISRDEIAVWNVVPWYIGDSDKYQKIRASNKQDIDEGVEYLPEILDAMVSLQCIVLAGAAARRAHVAISKMTTARILSCHHTSAQSMNANPLAAGENIEIFKYMKKTSK